MLWSIWLLLRSDAVVKSPARQPQTTIVPPSPTGPTTPPQLLQALNAARSLPIVPPVPTAPVPFAPTNLLLHARAGSFTPQDVTDAISAFKARTPDALAEIARLASSSDAVERLLGLYLRLEIEGPSLAILASGSSDPSPLISSQAAEWLFFHSRFDLWKNYIQDVRSAWTPAKKSHVIASLAANPSGAPELPAGLVILQLGRALPDLVGALLRAAPEIQGELEASLLDRSTAPRARSVLLDIFQETRPANYTSTLQKLILSHDEDSSARFKAFINYVSVADPLAGRAWIESVATTKTTSDPLAFRFDVAKRLFTERSNISSAAARTITRDKLTSALTSASSLRALSENDTQTLYLYIEQFQGNTPERADVPALQQIAALLESEPYCDYNARRLTAHIQALVHQSNLQ